MADAASIGANFSSYQGNANLGGSTLGVGQLDTRPIMDLARYTLMYNQAEYNQRQKDAEKIAAEIADATSYDLTTGIPKDAKVLQDKYKELTDYIAANPDAVNYRNTSKWTEYQKKKSDLLNDIKGAKVRDLLYEARRKEIAEEPNEARKRLMQQNLDADIDATEIRVPLPFSQKYDLSLPEIPKPNSLEFDVIQKGQNENVTRSFKVFDVANARRQGNVFGLNLEQTDFDPATPGGQQRLISKDQNFWIKGTEQLNAALQDPSLRVNGVLDETKLKGLSRQLVDLLKKTNEYLEVEKNKITSGAYRDKLGNVVSFGAGALNEEDYQPINYADGISPDELALAAQFAAWSGDQYKTTTQQTNDQIESDRLAEQMRHNRAAEAIDWDNLGLQKDKLKQASGEDLEGAESVINEAVSIIKKGEAGATTSNIFGFKRSGNIFDIADPATLQFYGKLDKDGQYYDVPDGVEYNKRTNQLNLVYRKTDKEGKPITNESGDQVVERKPLDERTWISGIVKRKFPNKDIGAINNIVDAVITKNNNLYELSKKWEQANSATNNNQSTNAPTPNSKWDKYKTN